MPIDYHKVRQTSIETGKRTDNIYPPVLFSKRNSRTAFTIKIFDTEMMRDILEENYYLNQSGVGCLSIDFLENKDTNKLYSVIPTRGLQVLYGEENPNFYALTSEQRDKILKKQSKIG